MPSRNFKYWSQKESTPRCVAAIVHKDYPGLYETPTAKTLVGVVERKLGVEVSYTTCLRGKNQAVADLRGDPEKGDERRALRADHVELPQRLGDPDDPGQRQERAGEHHQRRTQDITVDHLHAVWPSVLGRDRKGPRLSGDWGCILASGAGREHPILV